MHTNKTSLLVIFALLLLIFLSCSKESTGLNNTFEDQTLQLDENIENGSPIGTVNKSLADGYVFTIESQEPVGAVQVNAATGELYVADELLFDYELHPQLQATIRVANPNGSTTVDVVIQLNNLDDVVSFLDSSKPAYLEAENGDWITITESEYNLLGERMANVAQSGTNDAEYALEGTTSFELLNITFGNYNAHNIPENHRLFAFKYYATEENAEEVYIKISLADVSPAYVSLPTTLPSHRKGDQFFVLKGGSDPAIRELRLGMYSPKGGLVVIEPELDSEVLISRGNVGVLDEFPPTQNAVAKYQGLSTDIVQWD